MENSSIILIQLTCSSGPMYIHCVGGGPRELFLWTCYLFTVVFDYFCSWSYQYTLIPCEVSELLEYELPIQCFDLTLFLIYFVPYYLCGIIEKILLYFYEVRAFWTSFIDLRPKLKDKIWNFFHHWRDRTWEIYISGGVCLHFKGERVKSGPLRHLLCCKLGEEILIFASPKKIYLHSKMWRYKSSFTFQGNSGKEVEQLSFSP